MYHKKIVDIPIYYAKFIIHITDEIEKVNKITEMNDEEVYACAIYAEYKKGECGYHVFFNPSLSDPMTYGIIAHECMHSVFQLFKRRGIEIIFENQEPTTYLLEYLVDQVVKFFKEKKIEL